MINTSFGPRSSLARIDSGRRLGEALVEGRGEEVMIPGGSDDGGWSVFGGGGGGWSFCGVSGDFSVSGGFSGSVLVFVSAVSCGFFSSWSLSLACSRYNRSGSCWRSRRNFIAGLVRVFSPTSGR